MGRRCVFRDCKNDGTISLFRFPKDPTLRMAWIEYIQQYMPEWTGPTYSSVLCGSHFSDNSFDYGVELQRQFGLTSKRRLTQDAIPSEPMSIVSAIEIVDTNLTNQTEEIEIENEQNQIEANFTESDTDTLPTEVTNTGIKRSLTENLNDEVEQNQSDQSEGEEETERPHTRSRKRIKIKLVKRYPPGEQNDQEGENPYLDSPSRHIESSEEEVSSIYQSKRSKDKKKAAKAINKTEAASVLLDLRSNTPGMECDSPSPEVDPLEEEEPASPAKQTQTAYLPYVADLLTKQKALSHAHKLLIAENAELKEKLANVTKNTENRYCKRCSADLAVDNAVRSLALQNALSQKYMVPGGFSKDVVTVIPQYLPVKKVFLKDKMSNSKDKSPNERD